MFQLCEVVVVVVAAAAVVVVVVEEYRRRLHHHHHHHHHHPQSEKLLVFLIFSQIFSYTLNRNNKLCYNITGNSFAHAKDNEIENDQFFVKGLKEESRWKKIELFSEKRLNYSVYLKRSDQ